MGGTGSGGHNKKAIEKRAMEAKGDGRDAGHRRVAPPGKEIVIPGDIHSGVAFPHDKLPPVPKHLTSEGIFYWYQVFDNNPHLHPEIDWPEVAILAEQYDRIKEFREILSISPATVMVRGQMQAHPLYGGITVCETMILKIRDRLALNPIARARIDLVEVSVAGKLDDIQSRAEDRKKRWEIIQRNDSGDAVGSTPVGEETDIVEGEFAED
jgi:hypothetical protein